MGKQKFSSVAVFSQNVAFVRTLTSLVSLLIFLGVSGCAPRVKVLDNVPQGVPKGYVKFYYLPTEEKCPTTVAVYSTEKMDLSPYNDDIYGFPIGWDGEWGISKDIQSVLIAKKPGNYKFMIRALGIKEPMVYKILIQEGMVVPIRFNFKDIKISAYYNVLKQRVREVTFTVETVFEEPIPYVQDKPIK